MLLLVLLLTYFGEKLNYCGGDVVMSSRLSCCDMFGPRTLDRYNAFIRATKVFGVGMVNLGDQTLHCHKTNYSEK